MAYGAGCGSNNRREVASGPDRSVLSGAITLRERKRSASKLACASGAARGWASGATLEFGGRQLLVAARAADAPSDLYLANGAEHLVAAAAALRPEADAPASQPASFAGLALGRARKGSEVLN